MAYYSSSSTNNWSLPVKLVLISTGVVTLAVALKASAPVVSDFVVSEIPFIWSFLLSCLRPPYLYILINCIIISIFASSKLQPRSDDPVPEMRAAPPTPTPVTYAREEPAVQMKDFGLSGCVEDAVKALSEVRVLDSEGLETTVTGGHDAVPSRSGWNDRLPKQDSFELPFPNNEKENEKPPVTSRFAHRKSEKASAEGKALRVSRPKRQETLENTWKTITEGRPIPLTRHLKKSDTWETHGRCSNIQPADENTPPPKMKKCETFPDRNANTSPGSARLKREASLGQDELNRKVEAFIKKFNEEMRLQRQESLNQYNEMIRGGA